MSIHTERAVVASAERLERDRRELAARIERLADSDGTHVTALPALSLFRAGVPGVQLCAIYEPGLVVVAQGAKELQLGSETYRYDQANCLVTSIDLPVSAQVVIASPDRPYLCAMLRLDVGRIGELMAQAPPAPASAGRGIAASPVDAGMMDAVLRLVRLLDTPQDLPVLAPLIERELLYRLLAGDQGARLRQVAISGSRGQRVAYAIGWLKRHYREPLRIEALAETANMSPSSLHHHFRALTAMSPLQYQKRLRLQEARSLLLARQCDAASAAHRVGYESPSQFSREYSRLFGAPPLRDVEQLRDSGMPLDLTAGGC